MQVKNAISPQKLQRLKNILGMLGSDHAGERAAAGTKAAQILKEEGLTWDDVFQAGTRASPSPRDNLAMAAHNNRLLQENARLKKETHRLTQEMVRWRTLAQAATQTKPKSRLRTFNIVLNEKIDEIESALSVNEREEDFLESIRKRNSLTERQWRWFRVLAATADADISEIDPGE